MAKARKPLVDVDVKCPHCNAEIEIKVYRSRTNTPEPAEYEYDNVVQLRLPGLKIVGEAGQEG